MPTGPRFTASDDDSVSSASSSMPGAALSDALERVWQAEREIRRLTASRTVDVVLAYAEEVTPYRFESQLLAGRSFRAEVAALLKVTERQAENLIGVSRVLVSSFPATLEAVRSGAISWAHATVMVDELSALDTAAGQAIENLALSKAANQTPNQLGRLLRLERETRNPETIPERHAEAKKLRGMSVTDEADGMSTLFYRNNSVIVRAIFNRVDTAAKGMNGPDETRTVDQRRADLLAHVLLAKVDGEEFGVIPDEYDDENFTKWFRGIHATVAITVPVLTLLGQSAEPAIVEGRQPIDPGTATILAARAPSFLRILTHPETGVVLSIGRKRYKPPRDLRNHVQLRDGTCRFPGCEKQATSADIDHTVDWQYGGLTDATNLAALCPGHHTIKGDTRWSVVQSSDGKSVMTWTSPTGRVHKTFPQNPIAA